MKDAGLLKDNGMLFGQMNETRLGSFRVGHAALYHGELFP